MNWSPMNWSSMLSKTIAAAFRSAKEPDASSSNASEQQPVSDLRLQLNMPISDPDRCLQGSDFRKISIIPSKEEFNLAESQVVLPVIKVGLPYASVTEYLETHFRLLREDFIQPLRNGIEDYRNGIRKSESRVYENVRILGTKVGNSGVELRVKFATGRNFQLSTSKNLIFGSLLCMSHDGFQSFMWATVSGCARGIVGLQLTGDEYEELEASRTYVVVESPAYFEAYSHVLRNLQREVMEQIPFKEQLISLEPIVREPAYLLQRENHDMYEMQCIFPGHTSIHLLQDWPEWCCSLDESQKKALKHGLTKGLALIQGPPGTGKTFIGLLIVEILLANLKIGSGLNGPILVVCYTNHALDQFLEGIFKKEKNLIRVGRRSKSQVLGKCMFHNVIRKQRRCPESRARASARKKCLDIKRNIDKCMQILDCTKLTETLLRGVATEEQISNLFDDPWEKDTLKTWIESDPYLAVDEFEAYFPDSAPENEGSSQYGAEIDPYWTPKDEIEEISEVVVLQQPEKVDQVMPFQAVLHEPHVWDLPNEARKRLHQYWLEQVHRNAKQRLSELCKEYEAANQEYKAADSKAKIASLRRAKVIGMTTTGAARLYELLVDLKPEIVIVEEAAEVLESHILSCITADTKHLILIGDHLQLRPSVATHKLALENKLDVSLFERLVQGGVEHAALEVQRRMKPCISSLILSIYPRLKNHPRVMEYEDIKGFKSSLFFLDHTAPEKGSDSGDGKSKVNLVEADLVVEVCNYLLKQGCYEPKDITILAMYKGQVQEITRRLQQRLQYSDFAQASGIRKSWKCSLAGNAYPGNAPVTSQWMPRISSVDEFQGEENKIIILSLVRSNLIPGKDGPGKIGFLSIANRVNVALSRAKMGLYIFGNAKLLAEKSPLWKCIIGTLKEDGLVGPELQLRCQNHPDVETSIKQAQDFEQVEDGGCTQACTYHLECGHACPRRCHPGSHDNIICPKGCLKSLEGCPHRCNEPCHGATECPPCRELVEKQILECGHVQSMICSAPPNHSACLNPCQKLLPCGHNCTNSCESSCEAKCLRIVHKELPCGHSARIPCSSDTTECYELVLKELPCGHKARLPCVGNSAGYKCSEPCQEILEGCHHQCKGACSQCKQGKQHIECQHKCGRDLPCGHQCDAKCSISCPPCSRKCQRSCTHSRCPLTCGDPCKPCLEPCAWRCRHYKCNLLCYEVCKRPRCNQPCRRRLESCGHPCIGLCGEPCPKKCRICHPQTMDVITQKTLEGSTDSNRFLELIDCGHVFEVGGLDRWMDDTSESGNAEAILLKRCPACSTPIRNTYRYGNVVKKKLLQMEEVKKHVHGHELVRLGVENVNILNGGAALERVLEYFRDAIRLCPGLLEAHFNIACAFYSRSEFVQAVAHLRLVVSRSPFEKHVKQIPELPQKTPYSPVPRKRNVMLAAAAGHQANQSLATLALIQWASVMAKLRQFPVTIQLCDIVLNHAYENHEATANLKKRIPSHQVVKAVIIEIPSRSRWYQCPDGHIYAVGECERPAEAPSCPDCKAATDGPRDVPAAVANVQPRLQWKERR